MSDKEIIIDGCEFQSNCIEYKDISYLKIMPICAIHELSIACHDKVNKCKYYKLYKQLKRKEEECEELKERLNQAMYLSEGASRLYAKCKNIKYQKALDEIKNVIKSLESKNILTFPDLSLQENVKAIMVQCNSGYKQILDIINKVKGEQ